jgi:hypothetical protein
MAVNKVIATNVTALKGKYGNKYPRVRAAIDALIEADGARGLKTMLVALDSPSDMKRVKGKAVSKASDERGAKAAIDAIYKRYRPDYLLLLGAPDVVPHIQLTNPMTGTPDDDDDPSVPSDVPYASDAAWSRRPQNFVGPTRPGTRHAIEPSTPGISRSPQRCGPSPPPNRSPISSDRVRPC